MKARLPQGYGGSQKDMMKQFKQMQENMASTQEELAVREFTASSGGGMVTVTMTGEKKVTSVKITPKPSTRKTWRCSRT